MNPERIFDEISEKNLVFDSKSEFEKFVLGFVHKTFYKSAIFLFICGTISLYFILMNRYNFVFYIACVWFFFNEALIFDVSFACDELDEM